MSRGRNFDNHMTDMLTNLVLSLSPSPRSWQRAIAWGHSLTHSTALRISDFAISLHYSLLFSHQFIPVQTICFIKGNRAGASKPLQSKPDSCISPVTFFGHRQAKVCHRNHLGSTSLLIRGTNASSFAKKSRITNQQPPRSGIQLHELPPLPGRIPPPSPSIALRQPSRWRGQSQRGSRLCWGLMQRS